MIILSDKVFEYTTKLQELCSNVNSNKNDIYNTLIELGGELLYLKASVYNKEEENKKKNEFTKKYPEFFKFEDKKRCKLKDLFDRVFDVTVYGNEQLESSIMNKLIKNSYVYRKIEIEIIVNGIIDYIYSYVRHIGYYLTYLKHNFYGINVDSEDGLLEYSNESDKEIVITYGGIREYTEKTFVDLLNIIAYLEEYETFETIYIIYINSKHEEKIEYLSRYLFKARKVIENKYHKIIDIFEKKYKTITEDEEIMRGVKIK